jgi:serine/threonine protein phosphatase 1
MIYYAIGDIHGMYDHLQSMLSRIKLHHGREYPNEEYQIVLLGDYVDRGAQSKQVIDYLIEHQEKDNLIVLPGNHEQMMLGMIEEYDDGSFEKYMIWWARNGGFRTLQSYFPEDHPSRTPANWMSRQNCRDWSDEWKNKFPEHHKFLETVLFGGYSPNKTVYFLDYEDRIMFVHAGVIPAKELSQHNGQELLWSRDASFLTDSVKWIEETVDMVVHGHTPMVETARFGAHRSGLDAGVFSTGELCCGVFVDGERVDTLYVEGPPANYHPPSEFTRY